ncbi:MAG: hypothetical protein RL226_1731 [Bacteroidota bacterium]|jgi:riboflavin synthase
MFTGIIEQLGTVAAIEREGTNVHLTIESPLTPELKIDQSVSHNGVCLTVVSMSGNQYVVTAIEETLRRSNIGELAPGDEVNLERCMVMGGRLDGHIVQGHVDTLGEVVRVTPRDGSWEVEVKYQEQAASQGLVTVPKGSICVNGVSLTVVNSSESSFSVALIPYTWEHTNFKHFQPGSKVNLEFDILGKYIARLASAGALSLKSSVS